MQLWYILYVTPEISVRYLFRVTLYVKLMIKQTYSLFIVFLKKNRL